MSSSTIGRRGFVSARAPVAGAHAFVFVWDGPLEGPSSSKPSRLGRTTPPVLLRVAKGLTGGRIGGSSSAGAAGSRVAGGS